MSVEQGVPEPILIVEGAGRPAIAVDTGRRAVATGKAGVGLCEVLVPVVVFRMTIAVVAALGSRKISNAPRRETNANGGGGQQRASGPIADIRWTHGTYPLLASAWTMTRIV